MQKKLTYTQENFDNRYICYVERQFITAITIIVNHTGSDLDVTIKLFKNFLQKSPVVLGTKTNCQKVNRN